MVLRQYLFFPLSPRFSGYLLAGVHPLFVVSTMYSIKDEFKLGAGVPETDNTPPDY